MRFLVKVVVAIVLLYLLVACAARPEPIVVERPVFAKPPAELLAPCPGPPSDGTIGAELARLADIVRCERAKDEALRAWAGGLS